MNSHGPVALPFPSDVRGPQFPQTRYQGSKLRLLPWLEQHLSSLAFDSVLDAFGGSASVSYLFKRMGKEVTYNDNLAFNHQVGLALIENSHRLLDGETAEALITRDISKTYDQLIATTFGGVYYLDDENTWLDVVAQNIAADVDAHRRALGFWVLFQSCMVKRPYNLFHRKNLNVRTASVPRTFGNKVTWDRPFRQHFLRFVAEANRAVFDNGKRNRALCGDAVSVPGCFDLVYMDPPYLPARGSVTNYFDFYHFLEGLVAYPTWRERIDYDSKHRKLRDEYSPWCDRRAVHQAFDDLFARHSRSILAVSYRGDGVPTIDDLRALLVRHGKRVSTVQRPQQYALSTKRETEEVLLIGE